MPRNSAKKKTTATKPASLKEKAAAKAKAKTKIGKDSPVQPVPQTEPQIVNELRDVHSELVKQQDNLTKAESEVKKLKGDIGQLNIRREGLLNVLSGQGQYITQPKFEGLDGQSNGDPDPSEDGKAPEGEPAPDGETEPGEAG